VTKEKKLTPKQMAYLAIIDGVQSDLSNGADYIYHHPLTHEELPERTALAVEKNIKNVLYQLNKRLPEWARR
jgi:hypothetical protein